MMHNNNNNSSNNRIAFFQGQINKNKIKTFCRRKTFEKKASMTNCKKAIKKYDSAFIVVLAT